MTRKTLNAAVDTKHRRSGQLRGDGGFSNLEMVIFLPIALAALFLIVVAGRVTTHKVAVEAAAYEAARAYTAAGLGDAGAQAAREAASTALTSCAGGPAVSVPTGVGKGGQATVTVNCDVALRDLTGTFLAGPGSIAVKATGYSTFETYRNA